MIDFMANVYDGNPPLEVRARSFLANMNSGVRSLKESIVDGQVNMPLLSKYVKESSDAFNDAKIILDRMGNPENYLHYSKALNEGNEILGQIDDTIKNENIEDDIQNGIQNKIYQIEGAYNNAVLKAPKGAYRIVEMRSNGSIEYGLITDTFDIDRAIEEVRNYNLKKDSEDENDGTLKVARHIVNENGEFISYSNPSKKCFGKVSMN